MLAGEEMKICRVRIEDKKYIENEESFIHNTAFIARDNSVISVFEYKIKTHQKAEIINFKFFKDCDEGKILSEFIDELKYWNPYISLIECKEGIIDSQLLKSLNFIKNHIWKHEIRGALKVFKINIDEIVPEQLTVDEEKIKKALKWIKSPEDIVISCVKINNKIVCIDGYTRLVAAYNKGFKYVYGYYEETDDTEFYEVCLKWCEAEKITSIKDLSNRIVSPKEHEKLWINRCKNYLKET